MLKSQILEDLQKKHKNLSDEDIETLFKKAVDYSNESNFHLCKVFL